LSHFRLTLFSAACIAATSLTGCANMVSTAGTDAPQIQSSAPLQGNVHGGQQPVANSTVTLWAAGNAGYGSAATQLAQTTSDANGNFAFTTYSCPLSNSTTASQLIYITALGGKPTAALTNNQAAFMIALGDCLTVKALNPVTNINELSTVASITAMQQFFAPDTTNGLGSVGTSSTNVLGLSNAMKSINNLINPTYGTSFASRTISGAVTGYSTAPVVTVTTEQSKLNTMADMIAACINTNGSSSPACTTLFNNVGATAKDTLQAAYYMAVNPAGTGTPASCSTGTAVTTTPSICNLFSLVTSASPFQPTLAAAPTDLTLGVTFSSASAQTVTGGTAYFLNNPGFLAIDSLGNVWVANNAVATPAAGNSVSELSTVGVPEAQVLTTAGQLAGPRALLLDPANNVYVANYGSSGAGKSVTEFNATTLNASTYALASTSTGPEALASDGAGNIYIATAGLTAGSGDLEIIPAGNTAATGPAATQIATNVSAGNNSSMVLDSYNVVWLSNAANTATTQFICSSRPCTPTVTTAGGETAPQSIAVDQSNNIWIGNSSATAGSVSEIVATNTSTIIGAAGSPFSGGGLLSPISSIFGGSGNQWFANYTATGGTVTELTPAGAPVSPSVGFAHTFSGAQSVAIDASGNVWVGNAGTAAPNSFITEIIGASGPTITPIAANLPATPGGANTISTRP
jgi:hypothetical protein